MCRKTPDFAAMSYLERAVPQYAGMLQRRWPNSSAQEIPMTWETIAIDLDAVWEFIYHAPILDKRLRDEISFLFDLATFLHKGAPHPGQTED